MSQSLTDPRSFRRVRTQVKRNPVHAWIYLPASGHPRPGTGALPVQSREVFAERICWTIPSSIETYQS